MKKTCIYLLASIVLFMYGCGFANSSQNINDAYNAAKKGDWETAKTIAERRLKEVPTDNDAAVLLSLALFNTERNNPEVLMRAMRYIRQAATDMPDRYDIALVHGWMLLKTGASAEAKQPLQAAYDLHLKENASIGQETQGTIKYVLGYCCFRNQTFDEAEKYLTQATQSLPYSTWTRLYSDIACSLVYRQKFKEALAFLNKAIEVEKNRAALRKQKQEELERLKKENANEERIKKVEKEIAELAPEECMHAVYLNMAVVCDYLSYRNFNPVNPNDFKDGALSWYDYAKKSINAARTKAKSAKEQAELIRLAAAIDKRVAVRTRQ